MTLEQQRVRPARTLFNAKIPKFVNVGEANLKNMSIVEYMSDNKAAVAY